MDTGGLKCQPSALGLKQTCLLSKPQSKWTWMVSVEPISHTSKGGVVIHEPLYYSQFSTRKVSMTFASIRASPHFASLPFNGSLYGLSSQRAVFHFAQFHQAQEGNKGIYLIVFRRVKAGGTFLLFLKSGTRKRTQGWGHLVYFCFRHKVSYLYTYWINFLTSPKTCKDDNDASSQLLSAHRVPVLSALINM